MAKSIPIYTITMRGTFFAKGENGSILEPYEVVFPMGKKQLEQLKPTAFFRQHVAGLVMPRKYPNYQANNGSQLAEFYVAHSTCSVPEMLSEEIDLLTRTGLITYIEERGLPIEIYLYDDDMQLRQAIYDHRKDPEGFQKIQATYLKRKKGGIEIKKQFNEICSMDQLLAMNGIGEIKKEPATAGKSKSSKKFDDLDI